MVSAGVDGRVVEMNLHSSRKWIEVYPGKNSKN